MGLKEIKKVKGKIEENLKNDISYLEIYTEHIISSKNENAINKLIKKMIKLFDLDINEGTINWKKLNKENKIELIRDATKEIIKEYKKW